jgi:hypothetical protein
LGKGYQLAAKVRRAGFELVTTVDRISAAVDKMLQDTIPDLTAVPKVIASLGGFAGQLVPGSGVAGLIDNSLANVAKAQRLAVDRSSTEAAAKRAEAERLRASRALSEAVAELDKHHRLLVTSIGKLKARTQAYDAAAVNTALAACGVTELQNPLTALPEVVDVTAGKDGTYPIAINGGVAPYGVTALSNVPIGLTVKGPRGFDRTAEIVTTSALTAKGNLKVQIEDSRQKRVTVTVRVGDGGSGDGKVADKPKEKTASEKIKGIAEFTLSGTTFQIEDASYNESAKKYLVTVACTPSPDSPFDPTVVANALLATTVDGTGATVKVLVTNDEPKATLVVGAADKACIKEGMPTASSQRLTLLRRKVTAGSSGTGENSVYQAATALLQQNLCLRGLEIDGIWGPKSQERLERWRGKAGKEAAPAGSAPTTAEIALITSADRTTVAKWCD